MTKEDVGVLREQIEAGLTHLIADDYPRGVPAAAALDFQFRLITLLHLGDMPVQRSCILVLLEIGKSFYWVPSRAQYLLAVSRSSSPKGALCNKLSLLLRAVLLSPLYAARACPRFHGCPHLLAPARPRLPRFHPRLPVPEEQGRRRKQREK